MTKLTRIFGASIAAVLLVASCGGGTGEGTANPAVPATQQAQPAATAAQAAVPKFLIVVGDTIRGQQGLTDIEKVLGAPGIHCTQQSRFPQGGRIVWRMKVIDPLTNKYMDDKAISTFTVTFPDGKSDKFVYGGHGGTKENPEDMLWAAGYTVPLDYPTGAFKAKIEAKSVDGRVGTFEQFKVAFAGLTIVPVGKDYPPR